jgi:hypothetical protein
VNFIPTFSQPDAASYKSAAQYHQFFRSASRRRIFGSLGIAPQFGAFLASIAAVVSIIMTAAATAAAAMAAAVVATAMMAATTLVTSSRNGLAMES